MGSTGTVMTVSLPGTRSADGSRKTLQTFLENAVGHAVDDAVAETVADGQPGCEEGGRLVGIDPGALQEEVDDIRQPENVEDAGNSEKDRGVALLRTRLSLGRFAVGGAKTYAPFVNLLVVLLANAEDIEVRETNRCTRWGV